MLEALENTGIATWVRESPSIFAYTLVLSLHAIGLAMVLGGNTLVALRLLGRAKGIPLPVLRTLFPFIAAGFLINAVSGVLLFMAAATSTVTMPAFWAKMTFIVAGVVVGLRIKWRYLDDGAAMATGVVPDGARKLARLLLGCWAIALVSGRLMGYPAMVAGWLGL